MAERVFDLAVAITPEHIRQGLASLRTGGERASERGVCVCDLQAEHHGASADRRWGEHPHFGKLISDVEHRLTNPELHGHETPVWSRDPLRCRLRTAAFLPQPLDYECRQADGGRGRTSPPSFLAAQSLGPQQLGLSDLRATDAVARA